MALNDWSNEDSAHTRLVILESQIEYKNKLLCNCQEENKNLKRRIEEILETQENSNINTDKKLYNINVEIREILNRFI